MNTQKNILKGLAVGTAIAVGATAPSGNIQANHSEEMPIIYDGNIENYESQSRIDFYQYLAEVDMSNYDADFVNLFRSGKITINQNTYDVNDLFIEVGYENNQKKIFLVSCYNPDYDILTGSKKNDFVRESILIFPKSLCFFQIYEENKDELFDNNLNINQNRLTDVIEIIYSFDQTIHDKTPETAYKRDEIKQIK